MTKERAGLLAFALVMLATYVLLAPTHIVDGDNAEFITLGNVGGAAHPTGYPLLLLWVRATSWLPGESAAHSANLACALLGVAAALVLRAACRAWGARPLSASLAAAIFAAGPFVLRLHTEVEAFVLNDLVAATILLLAARRGPLRGIWRAAALGGVAGLGLCDHVTCALLAPIGILGVVRAAREARPVLAIAAATGALVLGLLPYLYLAATRESPLAWGQHLDSFGALIRHFTRQDYGGPVAFAPNPDAPPALDNLIALATFLGRAWLWAPLAAGLVALGYRIARPGETESRAAWILLAACFLLAGPVLAARFDVPLEGPGLFLVQRFFLLPALLLAIPCALALDRIPQLRFEAVLAPLAFVAVTATSLSYVQNQHSPALEAGVRNMLQSLPGGAIAIVHDDDLDFGSGYAQLVQGDRPDVTVIMWSAMNLPVYRERVEHRLGIEFPPGGAQGRSQWFARTALARGYDVFVDPNQFAILAAFPTYPHGILFRVLPGGTPLPSAKQVFALNKALYETFDLHYALPSADADWPVHVHERYVRMWQIIRNALVAEGDRDDAGIAHEIAMRLWPRAATSESGPSSP